MAGVTKEERIKRLIRGAEEDLELAKAQRRSAYKAFASGQAKATDYAAAMVEIDTRIERLKDGIEKYKAKL